LEDIRKKITYKPSLRPTIGKVKYTISYVEDSRNTKYLNRIETQNMVIDEDNVELYLEDYYRSFKNKTKIKMLFLKNFFLKKQDYIEPNLKGLYRQLKNNLFFLIF